MTRQLIFNLSSFLIHRVKHFEVLLQVDSSGFDILYCQLIYFKTLSVSHCDIPFITLVIQTHKLSF